MCGYVWIVAILWSVVRNDFLAIYMIDCGDTGIAVTLENDTVKALLIDRYRNSIGE